MVGEFPELQGIMGEKYALLQGEKPAVATAIREHYLPTSSEGELPETAIGAVLALDKLDSVFSFFSVGMIPTGSNDHMHFVVKPMALSELLKIKAGPSH